MEQYLDTFLKSINDNKHKTVNDDVNITSDKENLCKTLDIATESIITIKNISETEKF